MTADVILDLSYGDCGKGKVSKALCSSDKYTHCLRFNGGPNAGHTVYHEGEKIVTHQIPCGVFHGIKSIIGATCVVDADKLFAEINEIEALGVSVKGLLKIARNAHLITSQHLERDDLDMQIGTTRRGIGPCYSDKCLRVGVRAEKYSLLAPYLIDTYEELSRPDNRILCEGAQGFYLDIDWGDYPYVTSSPCTLAGVIQNGIPYHSIDRVIGVIKAYETYVGAKQFEPDDDPRLPLLRKLGEEFGATTGRPRQCNWLNLKNVIRAINFNGVTELIINKCDILYQLDNWGFYDSCGMYYESLSAKYFEKMIRSALKRECPSLTSITFSKSPINI